MAGFPINSLDAYLPKLLSAQYRVAICNQIHNENDEIVERKVVEMLSPGVRLQDEMLNKHTNNFLAAVYQVKEQWGISFLDISTGYFVLSSGSFKEVYNLLRKMQPSEILVAKTDEENFLQQFGTGYYLHLLDNWIFTEAYGRNNLLFN